MSEIEKREECWFERVGTKYGIHSDFKLPERSTSLSAGYDFFAPEDITIPSSWIFAKEDISLGQLFSPEAKFGLTSRMLLTPFLIRTRVKAHMADDMSLLLYVRSSSPSKLGLVMANSVGVIDADYYGNESNDGEIGFLVYNISNKPLKIKKGEKIGQGIFTRYHVTKDDSADGTRIGGFGSTGK